MVIRCRKRIRRKNNFVTLKTTDGRRVRLRVPRKVKPGESITINPKRLI